MQYCKKCTYPINAVNIQFDDDGVCTGCIAAEEKDTEIDWSQREQDFCDFIEQRRNINSDYDCIVPVSGGKDSHFQAWFLKNAGFNPLLVTYYTHNYPEIGEENLNNIGSSIGLDHYIFRPSYQLISKMNKVGFEMTGDMSWHFHCGAWTVPFQVGVKFKIPTLVYGEHGGIDLTGQFSLHDMPEFTKRQRNEELLRGFSHEDFIGKEGIKRSDLSWCVFPSDDEIKKIDLRGIFMGNYVYWDANKNLEVAKKCGFKTMPEPFDRTYRDFSNIDDIHENGIKDYLKFVKFGYGRVTDHTSKDIRLGYISRKKGIELVKKYDHIFPGKSFEHFAKMTNYDFESFMKVADSFRDPRVWKISENNWVKDTIWGGVQKFGEVYLDNESAKRFEQI